MRLIARLLAGLLVLLATLAVTAVVIVHTDRFREWARAQVVAAVDPLFPATVTIGALEGSPFGTLTARDVAIRYADTDVVRIARADASVSLRGILAGRAPRVTVAVERPTVHLQQNADGTWNIVAAFATEPAPAAPSEPAPSWLAIDIAPISVRDGLVTVRTTGAAADTGRAEQVSIDATAAIRPTGIAARVDALSAAVGIPDAPPIQVYAAAGYDDSVSPSLVTIPSLELKTERSTVVIEGKVSDLDAPTFDAVTTLTLAATDVRQITGVALRQDVTGTLQVTGPLSNLYGELTLAAGAATVSAISRINVAAEPLRYGGRATLDGLAVSQLLEGDLPGGVFAGTLSVRGEGTELRGIDALAGFTGRDVSWHNEPIGDVKTDAEVSKGTVTFTTTTSGGPAPTTATGTITLDDLLRFHVRAAVHGLDPSRLPGGRPDLRGSINLDATVDGSGTDLASLTANVAVDLQPSSIGRVAQMEGRLRASLANQRVRIDDLRLSAPGTSLTVTGDLGTEATAGVRLDVDLRVADVGPWLRLAAQDGSGALTLTGAATGNLDALQVAGTLAVQDLAAAGVQVADGSVRFDLAGVQSGRPTGTVTAAMDGLQAGLEFERVDARIGLATGMPATAAIDVTARDATQRTQRLTADVAYGGPDTVVRLREVALDTPAGPWRLARPATITQRANGLTIDDFRLENGPQILAIDGRVLPTFALTARAEGVDLALLNTVSGRDITDLAGRLDLDLSLAGPTNRPRGRGSLRLRDGTARVKPLGIQVTAGAADIRLDEDAIRIDEISAKAGDGFLSVGGSIGLRDYQPGEIDVALRLDEWPAIDTALYRATIAADLRAAGTVSAPAVRGRVDVLRASLRPDLGILGRQSLKRDPTIIVVGRPDTAAGTPATDRPAAGAEAPPDIYRNLLVDVAVGIARNSWVRHPDAVIELTGDLRASKSPGAALVMDGDIRTVRGWVAFRGRRFRIAEGEVRFTGGTPIDPSFDIVASHQFTGYRVEIVIGGTASKPALAFRSEPTLEQADILALIIFGRPVGQLGAGERQSLQSEAIEVAGTFAAQELGRSISDALGLDHLGIDIRQVDIRGGTVGLGTYLTEKTYIAIDQDISGKGGTKATIEYAITQHWQVQTSTSSAGNSEGGIIWRRRY